MVINVPYPRTEGILKGPLFLSNTLLVCNVSKGILGIGNYAIIHSGKRTIILNEESRNVISVILRVCLQTQVVHISVFV